MLSYWDWPPFCGMFQPNKSLACPIRARNVLNTPNEARLRNHPTVCSRSAPTGKLRPAGILTRRWLPTVQPPTTGETPGNYQLCEDTTEIQLDSEGQVFPLLEPKTRMSILTLRA
jgi:hypothetical protein